MFFLISTIVVLTLHSNNLVGTMPESVCRLRTEGKLRFLYADCAGDNPKVICASPSCCTACF